MITWQERSWKDELFCNDFNHIKFISETHYTIPGTSFALAMMVVQELKKKFIELFSELAGIYELSKDIVDSIIPFVLNYISRSLPEAMKEKGMILEAGIFLHHQAQLTNMNEG